MSGCGFLHVLADPTAERRDESIEDCGAGGIFPYLRVKEVFAFNVVGDRKGCRSRIRAGRGRAEDLPFGIARG